VFSRQWVFLWAFFMLNQEDTQMKKTIAFNQIAATERGGVLKILAGSVLTTSLLISQGGMAADGNNPCNELLTLGLYNTTQSSDATQSRSLVTSQFCSADFSKITDNNYQYGKSTNAQTLNIEASYGPASGSVGSSSSGSNTTVVSRDSIIQKQSELCTKGFNSQEYIKNTSDYAKVVYQGSLDAWNQCNNLNASGLKFKTTPSSNLQGLTIDLSAMSTGSALALTGVMQDGGKAVCTTTLAPRNPNLSRSGNVITVDASTYVPFNNSSTLSISCKREMIDDGLGGQYAEQTNLHFKTSAGTVVVPMAAIGKVPRVAYEKAVADINTTAVDLNKAIGTVSDNVVKLTESVNKTDKTVTSVSSSAVDAQTRLNASNQWGGIEKRIGYGNGVHVWGDKSATCPNGTYVVGINVSYRGTCLNQCDADGGIIGDIQLICRSLATAK
jgi:hypothetical protein